MCQRLRRPRQRREKGLDRPVAADQCDLAVPVLPERRVPGDCERLPDLFGNRPERTGNGELYEANDDPLEVNWALR